MSELLSREQILTHLLAVDTQMSAQVRGELIASFCATLDNKSQPSTPIIDALLADFAAKGEAS